MKPRKRNCTILFSLMSIFIFIAPLQSRAEESLCAQVKIQIKQELTLERQAFEAHMKINNGLSHLAIENVAIEVLFTDESGNAVLASSDPDNTSAVFLFGLIVWIISLMFPEQA